MNRLIRCVISFVLPFFCLLVSVSYAFEFEPNVQVPYYKGSQYRISFDMSTNINSSYTFSEVYSIAETYWTDQSNESIFLAMKDSLVSSGYTIWFGQSGQNPFNFLCYVWKDTECDVGAVLNSVSGVPTPYVTCKTGDNLYFYDLAYSCYFQRFGDKCASMRIISNYDPYFDYKYGPGKIKLLSTDSVGNPTWDGVTYYTPTFVGDTEPIEPETPTMPSNAEIAQAVQAFYNTIYNQPNIAFDDFFVLYDKSTNLYSYIGHTRGNAIGQVIVEPNGYYNGYKFDVQWWQFFLDEQNDSWEWQNITKYNNYYLYSSQGDIDTLKLVGQDKIDNLFTAGPWATSNTVIVYSTNDYPVKYITFSVESPDPVVEEGTIKGDQYTYDENLDITDNQYNPLENFVSVDYPSSLVSRAEFDKFMETFDENKDFLILPVDSNWIVIACNSLFNHFSSFIIMCAVFIIVERIMRG